MKVILTSRVANLGQIGEVVSVKNGYAKNFLIPSKKAICFTPNNQKLFESKKDEFEKLNQENLESATKIKNKIEGKNIVIIENASDDGRLYGSVSSSIIAGKVNDMVGSKSLSRSNIFLSKPIKEIGVYKIRLDLHSDVAVDARLIVTRSESEVDALLKAEEKSDKKDKKAKKTDEEVTSEANEKSAAENAEAEEKPAKKTRKKKAE